MGLIAHLWLVSYGKLQVCGDFSVCSKMHSWQLHLRQKQLQSFRG